MPHNIRRFVGLALAVGALALLPAAPFSAPASAATITVNTTDDELNADGDCSLREAIRAANMDVAVDACTAGSGADTIELPPGTYVLTIPGTGEDAAATGDLDITNDLTIIGAGAPVTIVNGGGLDGVFQVGPTSSAVKISRITITNGSAALGYGGGIDSRNLGNLTLFETVVSGNAGVGVLNWETSLTINNSTISGNTNEFAGSDGNGGGIRNEGGWVTIGNSTISGNTAYGDGGGIFQEGPIFVPSLDLNNVTITNNMSDANVDAIGNGGGLLISLGSVNLSNTIIAGNVDNTGDAPDCATDGLVKLTSAGYNLIGDDTGCTFNATTGDQVGAAIPLLGPLQDNDGPTRTHAPLGGSLAIDAGSPSTPGGGGGACEAADQRGMLRPTDGDGNATFVCDVGAFEFGGLPSCPVAPNLPPPGAGCFQYSFESTLVLRADAIDPINALNCTATGFLSVTHSALGDVGPPDGVFGLEDLEVEVFSLNGWIDCPGTLREDPESASSGLIEEQVNDTPGYLELPANGDFKLCLVFTPDPGVPLETLRNCPSIPGPEPIRLTCSGVDISSLDVFIDCAFDVTDGTPRFYNDAGEEGAKVTGGQFSLGSLQSVVREAVGGISVDPDLGALPLETADSSGSNAGSRAGLIAGITVGAFALAGAAWYARRRWLT